MAELDHRLFANYLNARGVARKQARRALGRRLA